MRCALATASSQTVKLLQTGIEIRMMPRTFATFVPNRYFRNCVQISDFSDFSVLPYVLALCLQM